MIIRPAYSDELGRAKARLEGHPVPAHAQFLVGMKETPVERIVAAFPYWKPPSRSSQGSDSASLLHFHLGLSANSCDAALLDDLLPQLESQAQAASCSALRLDTPLVKEHPLFTTLTERGFTIAQTDRTFSVPGEIVKSRSLRIYERLALKLPSHWSLTSLRGQDPEKLFAFAAQHSLISPQAFQNYWNTGSREHFEDAYSKVLLDGEAIIGLFLVTQRGDRELHIHVEACAPEYAAQSGLISATLRNASFSQCAEGFPEVFTWRADSEKHQQTANTALCQGGTELPLRHFLQKTLTP